MTNKTMDNFDLKKYLVENKLTKQSFSHSMQLIKNLTDQIKQKIEDLKLKYPENKFTITSNDKWRPDRTDLKGTYTLSTSGPSNDELKAELENI